MLSMTKAMDILATKTKEQGSSNALVAALGPSLPQADDNGNNMFLLDCQLLIYFHGQEIE